MMPLETRDLIIGLLFIALVLLVAEFLTRHGPATPRWLILAGLWGICSAMLLWSLGRSS